MQHKFFQYGVVAFVTFAIIVGRSAGRDLRPSEHGLAYQKDASAPTHNGDAKEMLSFFGGTTSSVPLPEAQNVGEDTWWSGNSDGRPRDVRRDHVRVGLLVATAVCGTAGVVLMVVSGVIFLVRRRKETTEAEGLSSNTQLPAVNEK